MENKTRVVVEWVLEYKETLSPTTHFLFTLSDNLAALSVP